IVKKPVVGFSTSARKPFNPADLAGGKSVASRTGEAYDARDRRPIGNFGLLLRRTGQSDGSYVRTTLGQLAARHLFQQRLWPAVVRERAERQQRRRDDHGCRSERHSR